jgi:hypothetical protein
MTSADPHSRARFGELVKLNMQGRRFLDQEQERRLLEDGVTRHGMSVDEASSTVRVAAEENQVTLERELARSVRELLRTLADRHDRISREDFKKVVAFYKARAGISEAEAERRVKRKMEELDLTAKPSGRVLRTRRWYRQIAD